MKTPFKDDDGKPQARILGGNRLGPVGGRIVAEVIFGLAMADNQSYLVQNPKWKPTIKDMSDEKTKFELADIVRYIESLMDGAGGRRSHPGFAVRHRTQKSRARGCRKAGVWPCGFDNVLGLIY